MAALRRPHGQLIQNRFGGNGPEPVYGVRLYVSYKRRILRRRTEADHHHHSESLCKVNITGSSTKEVTNATISFNVTTHFNDGRVGEIPGIDDFYRWVNVFQNDTRTYHLQPGAALMNQSFLLLGGWAPVANYSAVINVTSDEGTWFRLCANWEMLLRE
ncbi:MAG: hypothetical protein Q9171_003564 [Xanthocarpia ochracea]